MPANLYRLTIDIPLLSLPRDVNKVLIKNLYVDVDDTHIITAPLDYSAAIVAGLDTVVVLPATTFGSVYQLQLYGTDGMVLSAFFGMPDADSLLSDLNMYTAYPPRIFYPNAKINWGRIIGDINDQADLAEVMFTKSAAGELADELDGLIKWGNIKGSILDQEDLNDVMFTKSAADELKEELLSVGITGDDAYEVAVKDGFVGTRTEWLASLVGPKGDKGDKGMIGLKGDKGDPGDDADNTLFRQELDAQKLDTGITVVPQLVGQVPIKQSDLNALSVNVKSFDATLVAGGNATTAIQAALDSGAKYIEVSEDYAVRGNIYIRDSGVHLYSNNNATLDFSGRSSKANCITAAGSEGATYTVSSDIIKFSTSLTTDNVPTTISKGDIVVIESDEKHYFNQEGFNGEMIRVASVSGSKITFARRIRTNYSADKNIRVIKINTLKDISVTGIKLKGTGKQFSVGDHGISMRYVENPRISRCTTDDVLRNAIRIDSCFGGLVDFNNITLDEDETTSQIYYGVCFLNYTTGLVIAKNTVKRGRHGVVQSEDIGYGHCFDIIVFGNIIEDTYAAGLSTHVKVSNVLWEANIVTGCGGGIDLRSDGNLVTGNIFSGSNHLLGGVGVALRGRVSNTTISGNNQFSDWRYVSQFYMTADNTAPNNIEFSGNICTDCTYGLIWEHFGTVNSDGVTYNVTPAEDMRVLNNTFIGGTSQQLKMTGYFTDCTIDDNKHKFKGGTRNYAVFLQGLQNSTIDDVKARNSYGVYDGDVSVKDANGANVIRKSSNNTFGDITAFNQDPAFKILTSAGTDKSNRMVGSVNNMTGSGTRLINAGAILVDRSFMIIDTEALAATDDLTTLTGLMEGQEVTICSTIGTRKITIKHATGNIQCGADIVLNSPQDTASFIFFNGIFRLKSKQTNA